MFTNLHLRAALIHTIQQALAETHLENWKVMARNPQVMANADRVILVDYLYSRRNGFQGRDVIVKPREGVVKTVTELPDGWHIDIAPERTVIGQEQWVETVAWQISVFRKRLVNDNISTVIGDDVAKTLEAWLNSRHGAKVMRERKETPFAPIFAKEVRSKTYTDDSDIHQMEGALDFQMSVVQTLDLASADVTGLVITDVPV